MERAFAVYIPSKHARFVTKSLELCEDKSGYVRNSIVYIRHDTVSDLFLKLNHMAQKNFDN
jgi:hypothetical protein